LKSGRVFCRYSFLRNRSSVPGRGRRSYRPSRPHRSCRAMFNGSNPAPAPGGGRKWLPLMVIGGMAVVARILLPQMLGGVAPAPAATAAEADKNSLDYVPPAWPESPDAGSMLTRLAVGTVVVMVLCVGTLFLCRRWLRKLPSQPSVTSRMTIIETLPL